MKFFICFQIIMWKIIYNNITINYYSSFHFTLYKKLHKFEIFIIRTISKNTKVNNYKKLNLSCLIIKFSLFDYIR